MEHINEHRQLARILIVTDALFRISRSWYNPKAHTGDELFFDLSKVLYNNMTALAFWIDREPMTVKRNSAVTAMTDFWLKEYLSIRKMKTGTEELMLFRVACYTEAMALLLTDARALVKDFPVRRLNFVRIILNKMLTVFYDLYDEDQVSEGGMDLYNRSFQATVCMHGGDKSKRRKKKR